MKNFSLNDNSIAKSRHGGLILLDPEKRKEEIGSPLLLLGASASDYPVISSALAKLFSGAGFYGCLQPNCSFGNKSLFQVQMTSVLSIVSLHNALTMKHRCRFICDQLVLSNGIILCEGKRISHGWKSHKFRRSTIVPA
jgi:hypothetical protein